MAMSDRVQRIKVAFETADESRLGGERNKSSSMVYGREDAGSYRLREINKSMSPLQPSRRWDMISIWWSRSSI